MPITELVLKFLYDFLVNLIRLIVQLTCPTTCDYTNLAFDTEEVACIEEECHLEY
jgi:hypothetical protein